MEYCSRYGNQEINRNICSQNSKQQWLSKHTSQKHWTYALDYLHCLLNRDDLKKMKQEHSNTVNVYLMDHY